MIVLLSLCGIAPAHAQSADPPVTARPNILLIMLDDMGYNDLAINNDNTAINTPHLDAFARQGMRFTRHYATAVCSPARAALLTGLYPERVGFLPSGRGISPQIVTLPERLQDAGYTTWHLGKWHLGEYERESWPDRQGFDHWFGFLNQAFLGGVIEEGELRPAGISYENPWLMGDSEPGAYYTGHLTDILADRAIAALSELQASGQNWFLNLWFYAPHWPIEPAARFANNYPDTPAGHYRALIDQLDHNVGRVLAHLDALDAAGETIVVVVSDNGGTNFQVDNNAPFTGKKVRLTEGGLRTPLIVRWPDDSLNGQVFDGLVGIADLYPTLLDVIGVPVPEGLDSDSFLPRVQHASPAPERARFWEMATTNAWSMLSADGRWRLGVPFDPWRGAQPKLYDLQADPSGTDTVEPPPPQRYQQMLQDYQSWYRDVHTVNTTYETHASGAGTLSGSDFLRTPGDGTITFGIGVPDGFSGQLARQEGIWSLEREGNQVTARFGGLITLRGALQPGPACHPVVLSGNFHRQRRAGRREDEISMSLYIGGVELAAVKMMGVLDVGDAAMPTLIGNHDDAAPTASLPRPLMLNSRIDSRTAWTVEEFSAALCEGSDA
tara:strand:- start:9 stop:1838 length:1830 start_codon:yes stop_codon:yes gene_type:complete